MKYGMLRAGCASPKLVVADCNYNAEQIISTVNQATLQNIQLLVFPELSITGYTCADLFLQKTLREQSICALENICQQTQSKNILFVVGLPIVKESSIYNCAAFIFNGKVLAIIPKTFIPNYCEFYEQRWFTPYSSNNVENIFISNKIGQVPFGTNIILQDQKDSRFSVAAEICEDGWVPLSPSTKHALNGATIIANLSASNEVVGKACYRRNLVSSLSAKNISAYLYADASQDESSTDMIFSGHNIIACNGTILAQSVLFSKEYNITVADIDLEKIEQDRIRTTTFSSCANYSTNDYKKILFDAPEKTDEKIIGGIKKHPFVPQNKDERTERCLEVIEMQAEGLAKRLRHINLPSAVLGLSGGLDSTLALLVTARAFDKCNIDRKKIFAITMPCFGTTNRTYKNACLLAQKIGATLKEVDIKESVLKHFADIGQDQNCHDVTYENCQARERTQVLMDFANKINGIVIGTGDLSELALGWCTYNGDQMSMYGVNASIPKTLVRYLVDWFSEEAKKENNIALYEVLKDILDTPVSPELLPPEKGSISQKTEELVGPYELHDFFLYYVLRWGFTPKKIFYLAEQAFLQEKENVTDSENNFYTKQIIFKWLNSFYKRFFSQQFKRSCMPDGAKVGTVSLSPRGDWRMPSDASAALWLSQLKELGE